MNVFLRCQRCGGEGGGAGDEVSVFWGGCACECGLVSCGGCRGGVHCHTVGTVVRTECVETTMAHPRYLIAVP